MNNRHPQAPRKIQINIVNTSNKAKEAEFNRLFQQTGYFQSGDAPLLFKSVDLDEIDADSETVAAMKAVMAAKMHGMPGVLIDDTSLEIDGAPNVGIHVRWLLEHAPDKFNLYIDKAATFRCTLAVAHASVVYLAIGEVKGKIVAPRETSRENIFGFDSVFLPDGAVKTLSQDKPDQFNARALAVTNLARHRIKCVFVPHAEDWQGKWQHHSVFKPASRCRISEREKTMIKPNVLLP